MISYRLLHSSYAGPVNLGNANELSLNEMAEKIITVTDSRSQVASMPLPSDDPRVRRPKFDLAEQVLDGWESKIAVADGLGLTREYFVSELAQGDRSGD